MPNVFIKAIGSLGLQLGVYYTYSVIAARNHVNRMCLAADVPLIESGTAGYLGQVTVIKKVTLYIVH